MSLSQPPIGTVVTTDPVTGLPLTSPDAGIIDQIPVNSDPRALQDWSAVGRPSQSLYPDDFPWVMSTTHAQNSLNPQSAQAMQTDGNHRLLVNTGSSGGSSAVSVPMKQYNVTWSTPPGGNLQLYNSFPAAIIWGVSLSAELQSGNGSNGGKSITLGLQQHGGFTKFWIVNLALFYFDTDPGNNGGCGTVNLYPPYGIDLTGQFGSPLPTLDLIMFSPWTAIDFWLSVSYT